MKLNISYPATGCQKVFEVDDEQKIKHFYDKRMAQVSKFHIIWCRICSLLRGCIYFSL